MERTRDEMSKRVLVLGDGNEGVDIYIMIALAVFASAETVAT